MSDAQRFAILSLFAITASAAAAADVPPPALDGWIVTLGVGPNVFTSFPGANSVSVWPSGYLTFRRPGEPEAFVSPDDGLSFAIYDLGWLKAGPVARFISARSLNSSFGTIGNNQSFYGLHDVGFTAEIGGFVEIWPADFFRARFEARQGVSGADGFDANVAFDFVEHFGLFTVSGGPRLQFADTRFVSAFFSVAPWEAFLNGNVTPYQATGGLTSVGGLGAVKYQFAPSWSATAYGGVNRYVGSAGDSPIPNRLGSRDNFLAGLKAAYSFNWQGL